MKMNVVLLPYAIVALVAILLPTSSCDLINDTCKQTPDYRLCTSILWPDPRSRGADVTRLGLIMVDALKNQSTSTLVEIKNLLKTKPDLKVPLTACNKKYNFILKYDITVANDALHFGDPKFGEDAMRDSALEAQDCEDAFKSGSSPLTARNKRAHDISLVAVGIIRLLL